MSAEYYARFVNIGFDEFRAMAGDPSLSEYEKIGFPDSYRTGKDQAIFDDLCHKLPALSQRDRIVLDIGPGCSELARMVIRHCSAHAHQLVLVDSAEMLSLLPAQARLEKVPARFPACADLIARYAGRVDALICYSVFHYVFREGNSWEFIDRALSLLAPGGWMLLGDLPNAAKRKRFFASDAGIRHHQAFTGVAEVPPVEFNRLEPGAIDDAVLLSLVLRARTQGFDAYIVPQPPELPMANRREDILVFRP